jgi:hypothetical protein
MSFGLERQNKAGDIKSSTPAKASSTIHHMNNLNRDSPDYILHIQRTIGKQAVRFGFHSNAGFDFAKIGILQPKLEISQAGDAYEQEADRVAEQVMRMSSHPSGSTASVLTAKEEGIDRKCAACEIEKEEEKLNISRKPSIASGVETTDEITNEISNVLSSDGKTLDVSTREFMEPRFGYDFSNVKIHTDEIATQSANSVNASAYTVGNDIVFGEGLYEPNTLDGRKLLAHELTHVVQQSENRIQRLPFGISLPSGLRRLDSSVEIPLAKSVYVSSLDYSHIFLSDATGASGRPFTTYVPSPLPGIDGATIINVGTGLYSSPGSNRDLLIHELAHSWQSQHHTSHAQFMVNSVESQALAAATGGSAYCYVPGKWFGKYGAEQIAEQVENGEAAIVSHVSSISAGVPDPSNIASLAVPHWEKPGDPGVVC